MIPNPELAVEFLAKWLADYAKDNNRKGFIIVNTGDCRDTVLNYVCSEATKVHGGLKFSVVSVDEYTEPFMVAHKRAEYFDYLVVGPTDRSHGLLSRQYVKVGEGICDIFPFYDLEYSDIYQIGKHVFPGRYDFEQDIAEHQKMFEYCNHVERLYGIITNESPPHTHSRWPYFLQQQKEYIAKVWEREKHTRHKALDHKPFPKIPAHICRRNAQ